LFLLDCRQLYFGRKTPAASQGSDCVPNDQRELPDLTEGRVMTTVEPDTPDFLEQWSTFDGHARGSIGTLSLIDSVGQTKWSTRNKIWFLISNVADHLPTNWLRKII